MVLVTSCTNLCGMLDIVELLSLNCVKSFVLNCSFYFILLFNYCFPNILMNFIFIEWLIGLRIRHCTIFVKCKEALD
jgi:hypothetical protein